MKVGYFTVSLSVNGKPKKHYIHKLVAIHFLEVTSDEFVVNHKDGDKLNNHISNLECISRKENAVHWARDNHWSKNGRSIPKSIRSSGYCGRGHKLHTTKSGILYCKECRRLRDKVEELFPPKECDWSAINGYDYLISNTGLVWSNKTKRILKSGVDTPGYAYVILRKNGISKRISIHRLVVNAFVSEIPDGFVVDHINSNKTDNRIENLRILTRQENIRMSREKKRKDKSHGFKLDEEQISQIKWLSKNTHLKNADLVRFFKISTTMISAITNNKQWIHVSAKEPDLINEKLVSLIKKRSREILDLREIKWLSIFTKMRSIDISTRYRVSEDTVYLIKSKRSYHELDPIQPSWYQDQKP